MALPPSGTDGVSEKIGETAMILCEEWGSFFVSSQNRSLLFSFVSSSSGLRSRGPRTSLALPVSPSRCLCSYHIPLYSHIPVFRSIPLPKPAHLSLFFIPPHSPPPLRLSLSIYLSLSQSLRNQQLTTRVHALLRSESIARIVCVNFCPSDFPPRDASRADARWSGHPSHR